MVLIPIGILLVPMLVYNYFASRLICYKNLYFMVAPALIQRQLFLSTQLHTTFP